MRSPETVEKLSEDERDLIENYRRTKAGRRAVLLMLSASYRKIFPVDMPKLKLVTPAK